MKNIFFSFLFFIIMGCSSDAQVNWHKIEYYYSTGMVPAEYFYSYLITVNPDMTVNLKFDTPSTFGKEPKYSYELNLTSQQWGNLTSYIDENKILTTDFNQPDILHMDGPKEYAVFYYYPTDDPRVGLTPTQKRTPENPLPQDETMLKNLYSQLKSLVPDNVWKEINEKEGKELIRINNPSSTNWSSIQYYYSNGSLPPPYHYEYTITINPDRRGVLLYQYGYENIDHAISTHEFTVTPDQLNTLNNYLSGINFYNKSIPSVAEDKRPVGGSMNNVKVTIHNPDPNLDQPPRVIETPFFPVESFENDLNGLYSLIKSFVPESIWNEVRAKQSEKEK